MLSLPTVILCPTSASAPEALMSGPLRSMTITFERVFPQEDERAFAYRAVNACDEPGSAPETLRGTSPQT